MDERDIKEIKDELKQVSNSVIRLEGKLDSHIASERILHQQDLEYRKSFMERLDKYQETKAVMREHVNENTSFRKATSKRLWLVESGLILGLIGIGVYFVRTYVLHLPK